MERTEMLRWLAVTLSLGERSLEELTAWREAGADRDVVIELSAVRSSRPSL